jgi:hypothetical protein
VELLIGYNAEEMTVQVKQFIDLSDVLAIRFTCNHCGTSLSMPMSDSKLKDSRTPGAFIGDCPSCHRPWANFGGNRNDQTVTRFTSSLNVLKTALYGEKTQNLNAMPFGFSLSLEVAKPPES